MRADSNAAIADSLFGPAPKKPQHFRLLLPWSMFSVATLVAVLTLSLPIWLWLAVVAVNTVVIFRTTSRGVSAMGEDEWRHVLSMASA